MRRRSSRSSRALIFAAAMCACATHAYAQQSEPMSTDRPDYTNGVDVVHKTQIELGYTLTRSTDANPTTTQHSIGEVLLRLPFTTRAELRFAANSIVVTSAAAHSTNARQDGVIGTKIRLSENAGVIIDTSIPTGSAPDNGIGTTPEAVFSARAPLSTNLTLATNTGMSYNRTDSGRRGAFNGSVEIAWDASDATGAYLEAFGTDLTRDNSRDSFVNVGVLHRLTKDFQVDARVGRGLDESRTWFFGAGVAKRW